MNVHPGEILILYLAIVTLPALIMVILAAIFGVTFLGYLAFALIAIALPVGLLLGNKEG